MSLLIVLGFVFLALGMGASLGIYKIWFWHRQNLVYAFIPIGILFFIAEFETEIIEYFGSRVYFVVFSAFLLLISFYLFRFHPNFIKPKWIRKIEAQPEKIQEKMRKEVISSTADWKNLTKNEKSIDEWIRKIKAKKKA